MPDNNKIANDVLAAVGGRDNVANVTHCMTRLRFTLKDEGLPDTEEVKRIPGVLGAQISGGQYQIIIGQNVPKVYAAVCELGGFEQKRGLDENLDPDAPKEKLTPKVLGQRVLDYISGSMVAIIPIMMAGAMFKLVGVVVGPTMFNLVSAESDFYLLTQMMYSAAFYFLPVYLGYTAAKKIGASPVLGLLMGGVLIEPTFMEMAKAGEVSTFLVYGVLPAPVLAYSQTVLPILLSVAALYFVECFFKRVVPELLTTIFTPFLTMAVMVPVALCVLAPIGNMAGTLLGNFLFGFGSEGGIAAVIVMVLLSSVWPFLVMTGMHVVLITLANANILVAGSDSLVLVAAKIATWATFGMALGGFLRMRDKEEKASLLGYFISGFVGGVTEPALFGLGLKYRRPFIGMVAGGAVGGIWAAITHPSIYVGSISNFLGATLFLPGGTVNFVNGMIALLLAIGVAAAVTFVVGFKKEDLEPSAAERAAEGASGR